MSLLDVVIELLTLRVWTHRHVPRFTDDESILAVGALILFPAHSHPDFTRCKRFARELTDGQKTSADVIISTRPKNQNRGEAPEYRGVAINPRAADADTAAPDDQEKDPGIIYLPASKPPTATGKISRLDSTTYKRFAKRLTDDQKISLDVSSSITTSRNDKLYDLALKPRLQK